MKTRMIAIVLASLPFAAAADGFDYTFVEAGYVESELDVGAGDVDGDGLGLRGSLALNDTLHLFAEYASQDMDFDIDSTSWNIGAGAHWGLDKNLDFVAEAAWVKAEVDTPLGSADDDGLGVGAGLRFRATDKVELDGMIRYVDLDESDTSLAVGGRYYFTTAFALGGGFVFNDDDSGFHIGVRAEFGDSR